ncbi:hypothetical protein SKAU_G00267260 [Synaphobranchus kaupii]|uniref:SH2 domain-containing protein n=1 Tax=Synaphobranchus kaupii TaxID=118154 RepID=A0A9Q1IQ01_SYNKA|nr:hypothetical protein SKAU_G00267260 [Synaphobranchus kaupii]
MSFDSLPSKAEVMSWNSPHLADYLRKMDLGGCDKVIMKCGMTGRRFLNMSENDLQKFPKIHTPSRSPADRCPLLPPQHLRARIPHPEPESEQDLNPRWYVGKATRVDAEDKLRRINQDGTFLVRDSSRCSSTQPYTLMVLYQGKVFNIQIRYNSDEDLYLLGTGFKSSENFPGVKDIIEHHMRMPLLLIDAKDRRSGQQRQCLLAHPAGY